MANDRYILPVYDTNGTMQEVELSTLSGGYTGVAVLDTSGTSHEIDSDPAQNPPDGEFPVLDTNGTQHLIAFQLAEATGLYELSQNALYAMAAQVCEDTLSVSASFENAPATQIDPNGLVSWATVRIEWGRHEAIAFGSQEGRYRLMGDLVLTLYVGLEEGVAELLTKAQQAVAAFRSQTIPPVKTLDAYHTSNQRDGSWWTCEVRCEFRADRDYDLA